MSMSATQPHPSSLPEVAQRDRRVREHRAAATIAGVLYIVGTVAGVASRFVAYSPLHDADDPLAYAAEHSSTVATGALCSRSG